jgi:hypothetical protein
MDIKIEPGSVEVSALACNQEVWSMNPNRSRFFSDLIRALRSTQPQMGTRAIWKIMAACVLMLTPSPQIKASGYSHKEKYGH